MSRPQPISSYLNDVYLGQESVELLPEILDAEGIDRPLIVTDRNLRTAGFVERLPLEEPVVFDEVQTNPSIAMVQSGATMYADRDCNGLVALGGGSPIDTAKGIAIAQTHSAPPDAYAVQTDRELEEPLPPLVAIPTTAGSGSEVGRATLIVSSAGEKRAIIGPSLIPNVAICDPTLTTSLPPQLTAATGMDALSHCIETFCSPRYNPTADALALDGLTRGYQTIRRATDTGDDLDAREEMMIASLHGGCAFQKGLGAVHSLSHALGGDALDMTLHHGTLNAIFLPHVIRFNAQAIPEKIDTLRSAMGVPTETPLEDSISELLTDLPLPTCLSELDVDRDDIDHVVDTALDDHCTATNPRPLDREDVRSLYVSAL